ncbi:hypothetical protein [Methylorubrum suomiense]|uniref:Uncharacterized protein n=1 Tax=Methylorubrum suomiense TaxID=144191 RepID=A0ABQ4V4W6_9HYPH|nr:hypothetical protein [Methylorubrum suomiense]GJE78152.1 hypothetical protein BGCPKDLD_4763 [Methylorubrum suomiense]
MCHRATVLDPRDPDQWARIEVEYETLREPDDPSVGYRAPLHIQLDAPRELTPAQLADIEQQILARHL